MKILILLVFALVAHGVASEYVSVVGPRAVKLNSMYSVFVAGSTIDENSKVIVQFGSSLQYLTASNFAQQIHFNVTRNVNQLKVLLGNGADCKKSVISLKEGAPREYVTLIRLDKPIYKPGDRVRFLVLALKYDTKPFTIDYINVKILNSRGKVVRTFNKSPKDFKFDGSFIIPYEAKADKWTIQVELSKNQLVTTKTFYVEREPDSRVKVFLEAPSKVSIYDRQVSVNVFAKQYTGVFASGTATVNASITSMDDDDILAEGTKNMKISARDNQVTFNFKRDLGINIISDEYRIIFSVKFNDGLTQSSFEAENNRTILTAAGKYMLKYNNKPFHPGHKHELVVKVHTLNGSLIADQAMRVDMRATCDQTKYFRTEILKDGAVKFILNPLATTKFIDIELETDDSKENFRLEASKDEDFFEIRIAEKAFTEDGNVEVTAQSSMEMTTLNLLVFDHQGLIHSSKFSEANGLKSFNAPIKLQRNLFFGSTLVAFFIKNDKLYNSSVVLPLRSNTEKYLSVEFEDKNSEYEPNSNVSIVVKTKLNSFVSVMAVDQKIAFEGTHDIDAKGLKKAFISGRHNENAEVYEITSTPNAKCSDSEKRHFAKQVTNSGTQSTDGYVTAWNQEVDYDDADRTDTVQIKPTSYVSEEKAEDETFFRKFFPDVWIYDSFIANSSTFSLQKQLPDSMTTWKLSAFALHPEHGLSIAEPQFLKTSKEIYLEVNAPKTVRRGEVFEISFMPMAQNLTRNYGKVKVSLSDTLGNFQFINTNSTQSKCFNYTASEISTPETTAMGSKGKFLIQMTKEGSQYINMTALIEDQVVDVVELAIKVIPDGIYQHKNIELFIDLSKTGVTFEEAISIEVPDNAELLRAGVNFYGNLLGPALESFEESLLDNHEQDRLVRFSQALIAQKYLTATGKLNDEILKKIQDVLYEEYPYILELQSTTDGSFRREKLESDAIWFTSFIVQLLNDARHIIEFDVVLTDALKYLASKQKDDGSFPYENEAPHWDQMKKSKKMAKNYITAFVTITFLKCYNNETVTSSALSFLSKISLKNDLDKAITAYAFALANQETEAILKTIQYKFKNQNKKSYNMKSLFAEVASYITLYELKGNNSESVTSNVKWLVSQSKYFSTFDKIIAAEAICEYLIRTTVKNDGINMSVDYGNNNTLNFTILDSSSSQHETIQITENDVTLRLRANGNGAAIASVWYDFVIRKTKNDFYVITAKSDKLNQLQIGVEAKVYSFMPVIEVQIPSGYDYKSYNSLKEVSFEEKREDGLIVFRLKELHSNETLTFTIFLTKGAEVKGGQKVTIKVYQTYNPHFHEIKYIELGQEDCNRKELPPISTSNLVTSDKGAVFLIIPGDQKCIAHITGDRTAITAKKCNVETSMMINNAFVLIGEKFSEKNITINIKENKIIANHRKLTLETKSPIESTPLSYKPDFTPSKSCRIIIIKDEKLRVAEIKSEKIERKEENFLIKSDDDDEMPTPGSLLQCEDQDSKWYIMGMYDADSFVFVPVEVKNEEGFWKSTIHKKIDKIVDFVKDNFKNF